MTQWAGTELGAAGAGWQAWATLRGKGGALTLLVCTPLQLTDESSMFSLQWLAESINTIQSTPETQYKRSRIADDDSGGGGEEDGGRGISGGGQWWQWW